MLRFVIVSAAVMLCVPWAPASAQTSGEEEKVNRLITQLLQDKEVKNRRLALLDLEVYPRGKGVLQALSVALEKDSESVVRREVALMLARLGEDGKAAIPALATALKNDKDEAVRTACARALLQMVPHSRTVLPILAEALQDASAATRAATAEAINALGENAKQISPKLIEYLKSGVDKKGDAVARMHLALALGRLGDAGAKGVPVLIVVVADGGEEASVREAAAESLGRFGLDAPGAAKPLADILGDAKIDLTLRVAAAKALAKVEGETKQIWPALKIGLAERDITLRLLSIRASGQYGREEKEVVAALAKLARGDDDAEIRLAAIQELGILGPAARAAESDLKYIMTNDERDVVRQEAEAALQKIGKLRRALVPVTAELRVAAFSIAVGR